MPPKYKFEIVTMDSLVFSAEDVESVIMPAAKGYLGVLQGHTPYITQLSSGDVSIKKDAASLVNDAEWFVSGGFAKILPGSVTIFADKVEDKRARKEEKHTQK
ncbi:MAG TPA: ATP synthase F1 subunit epsilon [Candidatus Wallbacteria bacterium]|nr:ATP synthase F1 subunit epsilon [Candidatus Wallbacteria bacterium]